MKPWGKGTAVSSIAVLLLTALTSCSAPETQPTYPPVFQTVQAIHPEDIPGYNEAASPSLPNTWSVYGWIWPRAELGIPTRPIQGQPSIVSYPASDSATNLRLIEEAKCHFQYSSEDYALQCEIGSPLVDFGCTYLFNPFGSRSTLPPVYPLVAGCATKIRAEDQVFLFRTGCMDRFNISYIFRVGEQYVAASSPERLKTLAAPIDTAEKALAYAQLATGMKARYSFEVDYERMVFYQDRIEGTHVVPTDDGYIVYLFHSDICGCLTYLTSQLQVIVHRDGSIGWGAVTPVYLEYMSTCTD